MNLFDIPKLEQDLKTLESKTLEDGFWNDSKKSGKVLQEIKVIKNKKDKYLKLESELSNLEEMNELLQLEDDEALVNELLCLLSFNYNNRTNDRSTSKWKI